MLGLAVEFVPGSRTLRQSLGEALEAIGDLTKAAAVYKKTLQLLAADSTLTKPAKAALRKALEEHLSTLGH